MEERITKKYSLERRLGKGAYGIVWKATSKRSNRVVAIKKIFDAFRNATDAQRTFREIVYLKELIEHPNIIKILNVHRADNNSDLYLVFEYMETDLHRVIRHVSAKSTNSSQMKHNQQNNSILKPIHIQFITFQMLRALHYIHSAGVLHRDLKPSNVLLDRFCNCKIADFGLARSLVQIRPSQSQNGEKKLSNKNAFYINEEYNEDGGQGVENEEIDLLTDYVATRWYRAPEILSGSKKYTKGVDIWSLGCIIGEMVTTKPLFTGTNSQDQMDKIRNVFELDRGDVRSASSAKSTSTSRKLNKQPQVESSQITECQNSRLAQFLANRNCYGDDAKSANKTALCLDLIVRLLQFDTRERLTSDEALSHTYLSNFYVKSRDLVSRSPIVPPLSDNVQLGVNDYRKQIYKFLSNYKKKE